MALEGTPAAPLHKNSCLCLKTNPLGLLGSERDNVLKGLEEARGWGGIQVNVKTPRTWPLSRSSFLHSY
jgi:hypothetical protein